MKKILILLLFPLWISAANHTVGTGGTFTTIAQVNAHTFVAGDSVLFKRGETFYGTITVSQSGSSGSPIVYGAWGATNLPKPIITGLTTIRDWQTSNSVYTSYSAASTLDACNLLVIDGVNTPMGRTPNTGYYYYTAHTGTTVLKGNDIIGMPDWIGAEVAFNDQPWTTRRRVISANAGDSITFTNPEAITIANSNNFKFIIQNDIRTLDVQNEWYYDPSTKKIRIYSRSGEPVSVQIPTIEDLVIAGGRNYITFDNISFIGANSSVFNLGNVDYFTIQNCDMKYSGHSAVYGSYAGVCVGLTVNNCTIDESNNNGIGVSNYFDSVTVKNTTIKNTGMIFGATAILTSGTNGANGAVAISAPSANGESLFQNNVIENCGYSGIVYYGNNTIVDSNYVNKFCQVNHDGGAIYSANSSNEVISGLKVRYNIVINPITTETSSGITTQHDAGIYLDFYSQGIEATYNTIINPSGYGLFIVGYRNNVFNYNTTYDCRIGLICNTAIDPLTFKYNKIVIKSAEKYAIKIPSPAENIVPGLTADSNYYIQPNLDVRFDITVSSPYAHTYKTFAEWKTFSSGDANSKLSPFIINSDNFILFDYNTGGTNKIVSGLSGFKDLDNVAVTSYTLAPYESIILLYSGASSVPASSLIIPEGKIVKY